ncbi:MAG: hypothetical protein PF693_04540, partial [Spirochaetia bacterium]|nr:hypothetical protein [Spirochaetia bacterium]
MNNYRKTIKRLTEKQIKNEGIINNHILQLGRQLAKTELSTLDNTPLKDTYLEINRLSTHSEENRKKIDQVDNLEREINVLNSESVQNNKIINVKKKEVKTHYEELGFAAYTSFNENTQKDSAYEGLFVDVEKFEGKLTLIEKKINKITNLGTSKTLLNKMANRSKLIYLQTLLKTKHLNQSRLYSNLGEKVFKSDFLSVIGDTSLINNMKPILEAQELVETLVKKDESIFSKKNKLLDEIERLDGNGG